MKTILSTIFIFFSAVVVNAHFQLQFPAARGPFVEDDEPTFCDGFVNVTDNRTQFPLSGGFFTLNSEHPTWSLGVLISNVSNPNSFNNFSQIKPFFQTQGEGAFCIPLDIAASANGTNLQDGQNVTIQIVFDGGDGALYQCADLTLSRNANISSSVQCTNATGGGNTDSGDSSSGNSGSGALGLAAAFDVRLVGAMTAALLAIATL